jgi:phospholipid/cholesterol/gamma-HCH transport system substrate-binding protein
MKKISNEVKVGAVALITILVFIWLYNFLKGKDFLKSTAYYYCIYDKIGGLAESSPVEINGYKVGVVQSIDFVDETSGRLLVTFSVLKGFKLPVNTVAEIVPVSVIAGMKAQFVYGNGPGFYSYGDTIPGRLSESLLSSFEEEFTPLKKKIEDLLNVLDSVINSVNDVMDPEFKKNFAGTVSNLNSTTESLANIIHAKEQELKQTIESISKFSKMLSDNSDKMNNAIGNLETITDTLATSDLYASVTNLKNTLEKTSVLIGNLNDGKGTAGQLVTNDTLYNNLSASLESLNVLLKDIKDNPKKYVHFSIFGRKNSSAE